MSAEDFDIMFNEQYNELSALAEKRVRYLVIQHMLKNPEIHSFHKYNGEWFFTLRETPAVLYHDSEEGETFDISGRTVYGIFDTEMGVKQYVCYALEDFLDKWDPVFNLSGAATWVLRQGDKVEVQEW